MAYKNVWLPYGEERVFDLPGWGKIRQFYY